MIKHLYDVLDIEAAEDLNALFSRFTSVPFVANKQVLEVKPDMDVGPVLFILQSGSVEVTLFDPKPAESKVRSYGAGAVFGHLPESGVSLENGEIKTKAAGKMLVLSVADWQYLKINHLWRG